MANEKLEKVTLKLGFNDGLNGDKIKIKNKSINKLSTKSSSESLLAVADAISGLYKRDLVKIVKVEEKILQ